MNITVVNGTNSNKKWIEHEKSIIQLKDELIRRGHTVDYFPIRDMNFNYCLGCWDCWTKTPGRCRINDDAEGYVKSLSFTDIIIYISPISAGFVTSETKKAIDRFVPNALPYISMYQGECHHLERYPDKPVSLGIILLDDGNIGEKSREIIYKNFDRVEKNMRSNRSIRATLNTENYKEVADEIINN